MGLDIFENEGISEKRCVETEDWGFSVHFGLGFQGNYKSWFQKLQEFE